MILFIQVVIENMCLRVRQGLKKEKERRCKFRKQIITITNLILMSLERSKCSTISKIDSNKKVNLFPKIENVSLKISYKNSHKPHKMITPYIINKRYIFSEKYSNITKSNHKKNNILISF